MLKEIQAIKILGLQRESLNQLKEKISFTNATLKIQIMTIKKNILHLEIDSQS